MNRTITAVTLTAALLFGVAPAALAGQGDGPTCSGIVGDNHGQHVFGDYVTGIGHDFEWPPAGQANAAGGAVLPGGPGPGFHFPNGFAPGASFCIGALDSPGNSG